MHDAGRLKYDSWARLTLVSSKRWQGPRRPADLSLLRPTAVSAASL